MKKSNNASNLMKKTKVELIAIGKKLKLKGLYPLKKADIVERLLAATKQQDSLVVKKTRKSSSTLISIKEKESLSSKTLAETKKSELKNIKPTESDSSSKEFFLPDAYGDTKIVSMVKDPEWIFCYWEIHSEKRLEHGLEHQEILLRVYDITDITFDGKNAHHFFDTNINLNADNWYIQVPESARDYCIDLGYIDSKGQFITIARSNYISVPRNGISSVCDEEWMTVEELFKLSGGDRSRIPSSGSFEIEQMIMERFKMAISSEALVSSWTLPSSEEYVSKVNKE